MSADTPRLGVVVTRAEAADGPLTRLLEERGALVVLWSSITFEPPQDPGPFNDALGRLTDYDWICFSSPRAVDAVVTRVPNPPRTVRCAVVGPSTGNVLASAGWPVDLVPEEGSGEALVRAFGGAGDLNGARILLPESEIAREVIPEGLTGLGAVVDQVTAYRLVTLPLDGDACSASFHKGEVQVVTFASPSAMEGLRTGIGGDLFGRLAIEVPAAAMGPTTAAAVEAAGWKVIVSATEPTLEGLADAAIRAGRS